MKKKLDILKLAALSSLIWFISPPYINYQVTAEEKNTTNLETIRNKQNNTDLVTSQVEGFKAVAQNCNRDGESVTCNVLITSTKKDSEVKIFGRQPWGNGPYSRIIDLDGNEYMARSVRFGVREDRYLEVSLIQGIPEKVILNFVEVPLTVNKLAVLELDASNTFKLQFRGVSIE